MIDRLSALQAKGLPILRTSPEGLPREVTRILRTPAYGLNWQLAQRVPSRAPGKFWAVPGRGVVCVLSQQGAGAVASNCAKTKRAVAHGLAATLIAEAPGNPQITPDRRLMVGVAPAGARTMRIYTDGSVSSIRVIDGAFTVEDEADKPPQKMLPLD